MPAVDLQNLILALRPDLCRRFGFNRPQKSEDYLVWLLTNGVNEYQSLLKDATFLDRLQGRDETLGVTVLKAAIYRDRPDVRKVFALPAQRHDFEQWFWCHGVGEHKLWPWLTIAERSLALKVAQQTQSPWLEVLQGHDTQAQGRSSDLSKTSSPLPWGVNLVGYAFGQLGIGEDLRMTARALKAAGVPLAIVNTTPGKDIPQNDRSLEKWVLPEGRLGPYAINLFCMTALETGRFFAERGGEQFQNRYNIGYWPWELSKWPDSWKLVHPLVDEAWVSTRHIENALKPTFTGPIQIMPLVVAPEKNSHQWREPAQRNATRRKFRLPFEAKLFCYAFDLNSSIHRKNPQACIEAFLRAFPKGELTRSQVGLVIKTHTPKEGHREWEKLKSIAVLDDRIHIIEGTLPRRDLMALYAGCDVFVSLHRAEGFGRGIAEALQLGLHVIATYYSGNTDFCHRPEFSEQISQIPYRLVKVRAGQYPYATAQVWASPNVNAAAQAMRICQQAKSMSSQVPRGGWPCFSAEVLGNLYGQRLHNIFTNFYA
jgi:hypothetical protein